jgi:enamine deaminase RidA (YjgF/YER057c/UK114 family)
VAEAFDPPELWQPFGPFSQVAIQGDGRVVHLKSQVALDRDGRIVGPGDRRAPLRQVLENIRTALAVAQLHDRALPVEIPAIAESPPGSFRRPSTD